MRGLYPLLLALPLYAACEPADESRACTAIGCESGAFIVLRTPEGDWPAGSYRFAFTFDGAAHSCRVTLPDDLPSVPNQALPLPCEPALAAEMVQLGGDISLQVHEPGTPKTLELRVERDAQVVFEFSDKLDYEDYQPNGPGCEPTCRQSMLEFTL